MKSSFSSPTPCLCRLYKRTQDLSEWGYSEKSHSPSFLFSLYRYSIISQCVYLIVPLLNECSDFLRLPILPPCNFRERQILFTLSWGSLPQMAHLCLGMPSGWPIGRHSSGSEGHLVYTLPFPPPYSESCWACRLGFTICIFSGAINLPVYHSVINSGVHLFV